MTYWVAAVLGVVQGVFMFLPVSSTAHLVLTQHWLIQQGHPLLPPESPQMILFDLVVHVGTLVSIVVVFWPSLWQFTRNCITHARDWAAAGNLRAGPPLYLRLFLLGMLSVLATGIVGLTLKATFEQVFATPIVISVTLTLTGILLWWTDKLKPRMRGLKGINATVASIIGVAQGFALVPGLSRSALTIVFALFTGLKRRWAAEYSFFLAIPTILAATLVQGIEVWELGSPGGMSLAALAVGFVVSAVVGIISLKLVIYFLYRAQLKVFSFYVWAVAAAIAMGWLDLPL